MALAAAINTRHAEKFQSLKTIVHEEEIASGRILWALREN
jgi:hypothetical protein